MPELDAALLLAAWLTGLAGGSGHCLGMCGGIVGALGVRAQSGWRGTAVLLAAHAGRIGGYALAGALVGFVGINVAAAALGTDGIRALRIAAAVLVLLIGLQLLLGRPLLTSLERGGAKFWRAIAPWFRRLLPPRDPLAGALAGMLWGFLPCGLVYAQLAVAATSGGAVPGAALMIAFGLGTSVSLSVASVLLQSLGLRALPRQASGALLIAFAIWIALPVLQLAPSAQHTMH